MEKINKTNIMLKSPILSHSIQTQTKFKAPLSLSLSLSLKSRPMASSKPLSLQIKTQSSPSWPWFSDLVFSYLNLSSHTNSRFSLSLSLSLSLSKPLANVVWCLDLKTINQTQKGPTTVRGCGGQRWRIKAWGASAGVPHGRSDEHTSELQSPA